MKAHGWLKLLAATLFVSFALANDGVAGPPPVRRTLPGTTKGEASTRWIAPYVLAARQRVGPTGLTSVRWFDENGRVVREVAGPGVDARPEYVSDHADSRTTIHGVRSDWRFVLPTKPGPSGYITAVGDAFVHEFHPQEGEIAADIYVAGKLAGTVGPFLQYKGRDVQGAADASLAFLAWKTKDQTAAQLVVAGPDGKPRFRADCGEDVDSPIAARGGKGVLARVTTGREPPVRFRFFQEGGERASFDVGPNGGLAAWVSEAGLALFSTSIGDAYRYKLMDCTTGTTVWEIPEPVGHCPGACSAVSVVGDRLLFAGATFAAVDVASGRIVARCQPNAAIRSSPWFATLGDRLFVVTDEEFTEFSLADIAARQNGWQ
jgi:hypothetical protein